MRDKESFLLFGTLWMDEWLINILIKTFGARDKIQRHYYRHAHPNTNYSAKLKTRKQASKKSKFVSNVSFPP